MIKRVRGSERMISAFVTRTELSVHPGCQRRCVCHWVGTEQARLCGEGGLGTWPGASEASSDPPMRCRAALFTQHNAKHLLGPIVRAKALLLRWACPNGPLLQQRVVLSREMGDWCQSKKVIAQISWGQLDIRRNCLYVNQYNWIRQLNY